MLCPPKINIVWRSIMKDSASWERINLDPPEQPPPTKEQQNIRKLAEAETNRDLKKPIQQLLCDVHEEVHQTDRSVEENIIHANKRMVSMMARVALSNERYSGILLKLTWVLVFLTIILAIMTFIMIFNMK